MAKYRPKMTEEEAWKFLEQPKVMAIATLNEEGRPVNSYVWYLTKNRKIYVRVSPTGGKAKNIRRSPYVSCSIEDGKKYSELKCVILTGRAKEIVDRHVFRKIDAELVAKYDHLRDFSSFPTEWVERYHHQPHAIFEITPARIGSWDSSKATVRRHQE